MPSDVVQAAHRSLRHHGRTFALASNFLPPSSRDDAAALYALCRLVDDLADEADDAVQARRDLTTVLAFLRETAGGANPDARPLDEAEEGAADLVRAWVSVAERRCIPLYPLEALVAGVLTDAGPVAMADDHELFVYCYRVVPWHDKVVGLADAAVRTLPLEVAA